MSFLTKLKLSEWLLLVAVMLLSGVVYELHNAPGRYVPFQGADDFPRYMLDSRTGELFARTEDGWRSKIEGINW